MGDGLLKPKNKGLGIDLAGQAVSDGSILHFGVFELDGRTGTLTRSGRRVPLTPQAFDLLALLVERGGELVTRDEIRSALWGEDTIVEFEPAVNACISQIRAALGDSATRPRFIETLPRKGYRFVAPVIGGAHRRAPTRFVRPAYVLTGVFAVAALVWGLARSGTEPVTLAVLPIEAPAGDEALAVLATLLQERILIDATTRAPGTLVLARPAVEALRGTSRTMDAVRRMGADYWVDATFSRVQDGRVRLHAKVARVSDFRILWGHDYEFPPEVFVSHRSDLGSELAERLIAASEGPTAAGSSMETAWSDLALSGELMLVEGDLSRGIEYLERAVSGDPSNDTARGLLARALVRALLEGRGLPRKDSLERARREALRVLERRPDNRDALAALGAAMFWGADDAERAAAGRTLARAASVSQPLADAHVWYSAWLSAEGRHDLAIAEAAAAERAEPVSGRRASLARAYYLAGRFDEARSAATRVRELYPESSGPLIWLWLSAAAEGRLDEASDALERMTRSTRPDASGSARFRIALARHLEMLKAEHERGNDSAAFLAAAAALQLGDQDMAMRMLRTAVAERAPLAVFTNVCPALAPIRDHLSSGP